MTGAEARTARERLSLSVVGLAAELGITPRVVEAWEAGTIAVPKLHAGELAWRVAAAEREGALAASGLPECPTEREFELALETHPPRGQKEQLKRMEALLEHAERCPDCQAREQFLQQRFGPMPARPMPGLTGLLARVSERVERLPRPLRPVAWGALMFLAMSAFRVVLLAPRWTEQRGGWLMVLGGLAASAGIGAALGGLVTAYRAIRGEYSRP